MPIVSLQLTNLGPLDDVVFEFDEHVNVLVGPNNCGKSTALTALAHLVAYPFALPARLCRATPATFVLRYTGTSGAVQELRGTLPVDPATAENRPAWVSMLSTLGYTAFVPALRQSTGFRTPGPGLNTSGVGVGSRLPGKALELPEELYRRRALLPSNAVIMQDEIAITSLVELDAHAYRWNDPTLSGIITQVAAMASEITEGFPMEFLRVVANQEGLCPQFRTPDGDIPFTVLSQGTQSVMQWLTYLLAGYARYYGYPTNLAEQPGVVMIDEIDAHLHPAAQRRIIPVLQQHFPRLQICCSTHSPLMLAGLQASQMQLLSRNRHGQVTVSRNQTDVVGWSADEILRGFLGVEHPTDLATARRAQRLQALQRQEVLSSTEAAELAELQQTGSQTLPARLRLAPVPTAIPVEEPAVTRRPVKPRTQAPRVKRATGKAPTAATSRRPAKSK